MCYSVSLYTICCVYYFNPIFLTYETELIILCRIKSENVEEIMGDNESSSKVKYDPVMTPIFTILGLSILGVTALLTIAGIYYSFINPSF